MKTWLPVVAVLAVLAALPAHRAAAFPFGVPPNWDIRGHWAFHYANYVEGVSWDVSITSEDLVTGAIAGTGTWTGTRHDTGTSDFTGSVNDDQMYLEWGYNDIYATFAPNGSLTNVRILGDGVPRDLVIDAYSAKPVQQQQSHLAFTAQPQSTAPGTKLAPVTVTVLNGSGALDTSASGSITVSLGANPGGATFAGTRTRPLTGGTATFSDLTVSKAGQGYTLVATDSDASVASITSSPFDILGPHLVFTAQPRSGLPNKPLPPVTVTAEDSQGRTVTTAAGTVTIALGANPGHAAITGVRTLSQSLIGGSATFTGLSLTKAGKGYTFVATDSDPAVAGATSDPFDVNAGLSITGPTDHVWANGHAAASLTATLVDSAGRPLAGHALTLTASPADGVGIATPTVSTGPDGTAAFSATSTKTGAVTFTVTDATLPDTKATAAVAFDTHNVLVQFLGIRTGLSCGGRGSIQSCAVLDDAEHIDLNGFAPADARLIQTQGFTAGDILWYSYNGGSIDPSTGAWRPHNYACADTAQAYSRSIDALRSLLVSFGQANPNTDFYLAGHSQGGLIAFQSLGLIGQMPATTTLKGLVTLDSPLGGAPLIYMSTAAGFSCWHGPANNDIVDLYNTATDHTNQGSTATVLCGMLGDCSYGRGDSNRLAASDAAAKGVQVLTFGNADDAVYNSVNCLGRIASLLGDNTSTEVVSSAGGGMSHLGGNVGSGTACISASHAQVYSAHAADIVALVGSQPSKSGTVK